MRWGALRDNVKIKMESVTQLAAGPLFIKKTFLRSTFGVWGLSLISEAKRFFPRLRQSKKSVNPTKNDCDTWVVEQCECFSPFFTFLNWKRVTYFVVNGGPLNKSAKEFVVSRALMMLIVIEQACTTRLMKLQTRESRRRPSFHLSIHQHSSILSFTLYSTLSGL